MMKKSFLRYAVIIGFIMVLLSACCYPQAASPITRPLLWNIPNLERIKNDTNLYKITYQKIIEIADGYCNIPPIVITNKEKTFAPDNHYYCSVGGYWWPDSLHPEKNIHKDGIKNPWTKEYDANRLSELKERCVYLSIAYFLTHDDMFYNTFLKQIKAWFVDKETCMYPNFEYAAVVPGRNGNKGRISGMIQAYAFVDVIESILLFNTITPIDNTTLSAVKKWFASFVQWSENGRFGLALRKTNNNIGIAYDVMLTEMYLFVGEENNARTIVDNFAERRLAVQINDEGKQEAELKRSNAFSYSLFNLSHILDLCFMAQYFDSNYYQRHQRIIDRAYSYLLKYEKNQDKFPYKQIKSWDECKKRLYSQLNRRERLRGNNIDIFGKSDGPIAINVLLN